MWRILKSRPKSDDSDSAVITLYREKGDLKYIAELYSRYAQIVYATCFKYLRDEEECKDAVSNIFEKLVTDLKRFDVRQFNVWLHRIAYNYCMTQLQKKSKSFTLETEDLPDEDLIPEPQYGNIKDEQLIEAIRHLEQHQRSCIELFFFKMKSYQEIADITGFSLLQVKSYLQNGKRNLKIALTNGN